MKRDELEVLEIEEIQHYADIIAAAVSSFSPSISYEFAYEVAFDQLVTEQEITTESIEACAAAIREEHELKGVHWN
jgi:hypothetical protein